MWLQVSVWAPTDPCPDPGWPIQTFWVILFLDGQFLISSFVDMSLAWGNQGAWSAEGLTSIQFGIVLFTFISNSSTSSDKKGCCIAVNVRGSCFYCNKKVLFYSRNCSISLCLYLVSCLEQTLFSYHVSMTQSISGIAGDKPALQKVRLLMLHRIKNPSIGKNSHQTLPQENHSLLF